MNRQKKLAKKAKEQAPHEIPYIPTNKMIEINNMGKGGKMCQKFIEILQEFP